MFKTVKNVAKHSVIYGLGDLLTKLVGFVLIPLYTHHLSTAEYGALELLDLTSYVVGFVLAMGIAQAVMRFYFEYDRPEEQEQVVSVALLSVWAISVVGLVVLFLTAPWFSRLVFEGEQYSGEFRILFATLVITLSNEIPLIYLRIRQQSLRFISVSLVRVSINLTLNIYFIVGLSLGIRGILLSALVSNTLTGLYLGYYLLRRIRLSFSVALLLKMLRYSMPLIWSWAGSFTLHFADRFFLQRMASLSEVGVYALGYKFGFLLNVLLLAPFSRTWGPKQFEIAREEDAPQTFSRIFTYYCFLQLFLTVGIASMIGPVIRIVSESNYHPAAYYVPVILLAYNFNGAFSFLQFGMLQHKRTGLLAFCTLSAGVINIAGNILLIPTYGAWGAAWTTLVSFVYLAGVTYYFSQSLFYIPIEKLRLGKMIVCGLILYSATQTLPELYPALDALLGGAIAMLFPVLLIGLRFYEEEEKAKFREILSRLRNRSMPTVKLEE